MAQQSNLSYQRELLERLSLAQLVPMEPTLVALSCGVHHFLMPPGCVAWVAEMPEFWTPLPGQPPWVLGLAHVRSETRRLVDLGFALGASSFESRLRGGMSPRVYADSRSFDAWVAFPGNESLALRADPSEILAERESRWLLARAAASSGSAPS